MQDNQKCSMDEHNQVDAVSFCKECKLYMCNNCIKHHLKLFKNKHHEFKIDKDNSINYDDVFTGLCKENNHSYE